MLPKRKLIKKRHRRPCQTEIAPEPIPTSLLQKLQSSSSKTQEQAIAFIANLCFIDATQMNKSILTQIISLLYQSGTVLVHQCLFAIVNLFELDSRIIQLMFNMGLDKALMKLGGHTELLQPMLVLLTVASNDIPKQYRYLLEGAAAALEARHLQGKDAEIVLEYLGRVEINISKQDIYLKLEQILCKDVNLKKRALALSILLKKEGNRFQKQLMELVQQIINDINLEEQYKINLKPEQKSFSENKQIQTDLMEQEEGEQIVLQKPINYGKFVETVEAVQLVMEMLLQKMQNEWQDENDSDSDEEEIVEKISIQKNSLDSNNIKDLITKYFIQNPVGLIRNTSLTFLEGQNINHLSLRMLAYLPLSNKQKVVEIVINSLRAMIEINIEEVICEGIAVGLHLLLLCQPYNLAHTVLIELGQKVLKINQNFKQCWLLLLQLYSVCFNPEKTVVSIDENRRVALILRSLLINIPYQQLQQWRGQTIDVLFDIFSNQNFDICFIELGFIGILEMVIQSSGKNKKKKFIRQVLVDIQRFLDYKRTMIKS